MGTIYQRFSGGGRFSGGCWVRVEGSANGRHFRAATNDERIYWLIEAELDWRATSDEAQSDLDELAVRYSLVAVSV